MSESDYMDICEQLSRDLAKAREEIAQLRHDIDAYRLSLGYMVRGNHDGLLSDGTAPVNRNAIDVADMHEAQEEAYDALWKEKELLLKVLKDWQEFADDSTASCYSEQESLDYLKARTARIVDPCS